MSECPCQCHGQSALDARCDVEGGCGHLHDDSPRPSSTTLGNIGPCVFPGCRDVDNNPRLTSVVVCTPCRNRYRRLIDRLFWNYVIIRSTMPRPQGIGDDRPVASPTREYGHPAEAASDMARDIADQLNEAHDGLAEHRGDDPPPHPGSREPGRVRAAQHYLTSWLNDLCTWPAAADTAEAIADLDRRVRRLLGETNPVKPLTVPCPDCDLLTMVRYLTVSGDDSVECRNCGYTVEERYYGLWARMYLDRLLGNALDEVA